MGRKFKSLLPLETQKFQTLDILITSRKGDKKNDAIYWNNKCTSLENKEMELQATAFETPIFHERLELSVRK